MGFVAADCCRYCVDGGGARHDLYGTVRNDVLLMSAKYICNLLIKLEEKVAREVVLRKPVGKP